MIAFTVYGDPVAQGRPRFTKMGKSYDPKKSSDFKYWVKLIASQHAPKKLLEEALKLEIVFYRPIPKSFSKKRMAQADAGQIIPVTKPDLDNYLKGIKDALNGVIWRDDSCVTDVVMRKRYSCKPRIELVIKQAVVNQK